MVLFNLKVFIWFDGLKWIVNVNLIVFLELWCEYFVGCEFLFFSDFEVEFLYDGLVKVFLIYDLDMFVQFMDGFYYIDEVVLDEMFEWLFE